MCTQGTAHVCEMSGRRAGSCICLTMRLESWRDERQTTNGRRWDEWKEKRQVEGKETSFELDISGAGHTRVSVQEIGKKKGTASL